MYFRDRVSETWDFLFLLIFFPGQQQLAINSHWLILVKGKSSFVRLLFTEHTIFFWLHVKFYYEHDLAGCSPWHRGVLRSVGSNTCPGDWGWGCIWPMATMSSSPSAVNLGKPRLSGDVDLLAARELELGSLQGFSHTFWFLQLGARGPDDLVSMNPGRCALELPQSMLNTYLEPPLGTALGSETWISSGKLSPRSLRVSYTSNRLHTLPRGCCSQPLN